MKLCKHCSTNVSQAKGHTVRPEYYTSCHCCSFLYTLAIVRAEMKATSIIMLLEVALNLTTILITNHLLRFSSQTDWLLKPFSLPTDKLTALDPADHKQRTARNAVKISRKVCSGLRCVAMARMILKDFPFAILRTGLGGN